MSSPSHPVKPPRRTFEGIRAANGLTLGNLTSLRQEVDDVLPGMLLAAGISLDLTWDHILALEGLGDKSIPTLVANIEASKQRPLHRVLFALGIIHVGSEIAELLTQRYASLNEMAEATPEDLTEIPGIGPKIAESVADYFAVPLNQRVLKDMETAGVVLHHDIREVQQTAADDLPFSGKNFVVTGTLSGYTRREAEAKIKTLGGSVASAVTRKTDYLVAGASPGSKVAAAGRLGTEVLDEAAFLELIEQESTEQVA